MSNFYCDVLEGDAINMMIKFYGVNDLAASYFLERIEEFFRNWDERVFEPSAKTILELHNIKRYIDVGMRLRNWTDEQFLEYRELCDSIPSILGRYFNNISNENIQAVCSESLHFHADDFWQLVCDYNVYQRIEDTVFRSLLETSPSMIKYILEHQSLVYKFGRVLAEFLTKNAYTAEMLLKQFSGEKDGHKKLFFPSEFTEQMREKSLWNYLEYDDANFNYLGLLERSQYSKEFPVTDKLKLAAKRKRLAYQEEFFSNTKDFGVSCGVEVSFKSIPDGFVETYHSNDKGICLGYAYSKEWVEENRDYLILLNNFIHLFRYVDKYSRCAFVSLKADLGVLERHMGVRGYKDYACGLKFMFKQNLSFLQMYAYYTELQQLQINIEDIIQWFFEIYLKEEFDADGFRYIPSSIGTTYIEKCKLLASAIDGVLKQYSLFVKDGRVDRELLEISSKPVVFHDISSVLIDKYAYVKSEAIQAEMFSLFSDQSMMHYTEKTKDTYRTLPHMLSSVRMYKNDFADFQRKELDWLIERGSVQIRKDGELKINETRVAILEDMYYNEVVCPLHYENSAYYEQVRLFINSDDFRYERTLFSKPEQDYLSYMLNKASFNNGLDLRNKYIHDTYSLDEDEQIRDYMELLKIMVLIMIKINDELILRESKERGGYTNKNIDVNN